MAVIDVNEVPGNEPDNQETLSPRLITYDDAYSLEVAGVESEAVPYGEPLELHLPAKRREVAGYVVGLDKNPIPIIPPEHIGVNRWLAYCDLDPATDEVFTTLEFYAYCNGVGVELEIEDAEDDGDEDEILVEADPHHPLAEKLINQQGETETHE